MIFFLQRVDDSVLSRQFRRRAFCAKNDVFIIVSASETGSDQRRVAEERRVDQRLIQNTALAQDGRVELRAKERELLLRQLLLRIDDLN